jgi:hypothetical protein
LLVVTSLLLTAVGVSTTPVGAATAAAQPANATGKQPEKTALNSPVLNRPEARTGSQANEDDPHNGLIACTSAMDVDGDPAEVGCDGHYLRFIHLHDSGFSKGVRFGIDDPGGNPIYYSLSVTYTVFTDNHPGNQYLNNSFNFEIENPVVGKGASGNSDGEPNAGTFSYQASGSFDPSWWHSFSVNAGLAGLWPYDKKQIDNRAVPE